jgi:hypothetical protein
MKKISDTQAAGSEPGCPGTNGSLEKGTGNRMNVHSRGARRALAAVCSTAVVAAGAAFFVASPASAAGVTLTYGPTPTSATITNSDPTGATGASIAYGLKAVGTTSTAMKVNVLTAPSGGALYYERAAANAAPAANPAGNAVAQTATGTAAATTLTGSAVTGANLSGHALKISKAGEVTEIVIVTSDTSASTTWTLDRPLAAAHTGATVRDLGAVGGIDPFYTAAAGTSAPVTNFAAADNLYFGAVTPGTYTFQMYADSNGNNSYDSAQDDATPVFTLTVKDVNATTTDTADDLSPSLSVASSIGVGQAISPTVTTGLTLTDTRGLSGGVGALGSAIAAASTITFTANGTGIGAGGGASTFDGTYITETSAASSAVGAGPATTTFTIGSGITRTASTTFVGNDVTGVAEDVKDFTGWVKDAAGTNARNVALKVGATDVGYTATVTKNAGADAVAGATVFFTLTTGTNSPALTADGTLVSSTATTKVYSAVSDSSGVATLKVTSGTTTAGTTYTVKPSTNGVDGDTLTAIYAAATATAIDNTNSSASLLAVPGSSVTLTGRLLDQFDGVYTPSGSDPVQVAVRMPAAGATVGNASFSGGAFSFTYTPSTTPTAGTQNTWDFYYNGSIDGTDSAINWTSAASASSVTITAPVAAASVTQQMGTAALAAGTAVTGLVLDGSNAVLAYKPVTLTGSEGVYFSSVAAPGTTSTDDLVKELTVVGNGSGSYTAYAFFTKPGTATINVKSGDATKSVDVAVTQASDPYKVIAFDTSLAPSGTSVVSGKVTNAFGFPVSGAVVNLSLGTSTVAALGNSSVTTGGDGSWSTSVTGATDADGQATLTATLNGQTTNAKPHAEWLTKAGLTLDPGSYQDSAEITVDPEINKTTLSAPGSRVGAGKVTVYGHAKPKSTVEIYAKPAGSSMPFALVGVTDADSAGDWADDEWVSGSTTFYAKTSAGSSGTVTVVVTTPPAPAKAPKITKAAAKVLGKGKVTLTVTGNGNAKSTVVVYQLVGKKYVKVTTIKVNAKGVASGTVKLAKGKKTVKLVYANGSKSVTKVVTITVK